MTSFLKISTQRSIGNVLQRKFRSKFCVSWALGMSLDKTLMEGGVGVSRAVGGDQQLCVCKIGRVNRHQLDLDRPLRKPA